MDQPSGSTKDYDEDRQDCVEIGGAPVGPGRWNDEACTYRSKFICEKTVSGVTSTHEKTLPGTVAGKIDFVEVISLKKNTSVAREVGWMGFFPEQKKCM